MILLCESEFKDEGLSVFFFEEEKKMEFQDLFNDVDDIDDVDDDVDDDDDDDEWCKQLPGQMGTSLVESVEDMPFYTDILAQRKRPRKKKSSDGNGNDDDGDDADDDDAGSVGQENQDINVDMNAHDETLDFEDNDTNNFNHHKEANHAHGSNYTGNSDDSDGENDQMLNRINRLSLNVPQGCRDDHDHDHDHDHELSDSHSSGVIDLLDSSDEEEQQRQRRRHGMLLHYDISATDMDLCSSPIKTATNRRVVAIDLTGDSPMSIQNRSYGYDYCLDGDDDDDDDDSSSNGTIDLCSPDRATRRV